ncbi:TetR family transcriptional regulator C-terminal domain-containing protein [Aeromicrobium sp. CF4.19]|uniref:TetR family transcriptional regulator C-terminal domain-containing protein n=1 Tax=Aeromicrobium sp. CF4.19 TaxID=3373082 RepID=UPI003EE51D80
MLTAPVADRVRLALADREMTQRELADAAELEVTKLSKALGGTRRFSIEELRRLAEVLEVDLRWLTGDGDDRPPAIAPSGLSALSGDLYAGPAGERRLVIVRAAWRLVAERGYSRVEVADVADRAGVSPSQVQEHFESRRALLDETLRLAALQAYERQSTALADVADGVERLDRLIDLQLPRSGTLDLEWSIWLQVWAQAAIDPTIQALHAEAYSRWLHTVRAAIELGQQQGSCRTGDAEEMAARLTALVDGLGLQLVTGRPGRTLATTRAAVDDHLRAHVLDPDQPTTGRKP